MAPTRYSVTDVVIETPRYGGVGGSVTSGAGGEHDILGHGWVEIEDGTMTIAVHPRGVVGMLEPKEWRTYLLDDITPWRAAGASVTFRRRGAGRICH